MRYLVKQPEKYRKAKSKSKRLNPSWHFDTEQEAKAFADSFKECWVDVWFEGKIVHSNYSKAVPDWFRKIKEVA